MKNLLNIDHNNHKCIWMTAGIINYKLCNCEFHCESCAFDKVMQMQDKINIPVENGRSESRETEMDSTTVSLINQYLYCFLSDIKIRLDRFYHPSHLWYRLESDTVVSVGINKLLLKILEPLQQIKLPEAGKQIKKDQPLFHIIRGNMKISLPGIVTGKIIEINERILTNGPDTDPEDSHYFKVEVNNVRENFEQFCSNICSLKYFVDMVSLLRHYLNRTFHRYRVTKLGITLTDGGQMQVSLEKVLGEKNYPQLLNELI